jgi:lycopene beta-cyclase
MPRYDYIIAGAGASGLSLLMRMIESGKFSDKKILLVDRAPKTVNDRTWCFWEQGKGFFEEIVYRQWQKLSFISDAYFSLLEMGDYHYKMIRGIDFYEFCFARIKQQPNIEIKYGELKFVENSHLTRIYIDDTELKVGSATVFNSISRKEQSTRKTIRLLQHFKGWIIETPHNAFDPGAATLMDFRPQQNHGTTFVYVLPLAPNRALVEYTLFTGSLLEQHEYKRELEIYIREQLGLSDYAIVEEEFGIIPMTNARFPFYDRGVYYIGTAGGQTKASTGYTFQFIQKQSQQIVERLVNGQSIQTLPPPPPRFRFYDSVLLQVLSERKLEGKEVFTHLFKKNKASSIFKFLDNESTIGEELKLISTLPTGPFFMAALRQFS